MLFFFLLKEACSVNAYLELQGKLALLCHSQTATVHSSTPEVSFTDTEIN